MNKTQFDDPKEQVKAILRERRKKELHWYALFVQGNHERSIATALLDRERENNALPTRMRKPAVVDQVFVPTKQVKRKWSDRTKVVDVVLTTGMIFIRMKLEYQRDLYIDPYIKHFLYDRDSHTPAIIPDAPAPITVTVVIFLSRLSACFFPCILIL